MKDGDLFKGIVLQTRADQRTVFSNGVYMRLRAVPADQSAPWPTLGVSELTVWPDTPKTDVVFRLPRAVSLPSSGSYYALDFVLDPDGGTQAFGMMAYGLQSGSNLDFYFALSTIVPVATAQFYSWEELTGADIAVSGMDATKISAALAGKLDKSGGTVTGDLDIGPNSNYSAKFESDPSGVVTLAFYDSIGNTLVIGGGKLFYKRYDWQAGVELFFPSTDGWLALTAGTGHTGNLAALDAGGNPTDAGWTAGDLARYALVTKSIVNNTVALDDRADNYVDARSLGSSDSLDIDFPALVDGKARDFVLAVECGANPPTISYAALVTIMAEDASSITPEEGMNIYSFKEFKTNMFIASRKLVVTVVNNSSENG